MRDVEQRREFNVNCLSPRGAREMKSKQIVCDLKKSVEICHIDSPAMTFSVPVKD